MIEVTQLLRVLIVDDDDDQRHLLKLLFAEHGIVDVVEATDGIEAIATASRSLPDLVVLDLAMPGRSGLDVLPELLATVADVRIVVLSNFPARRVSRACAERGALGFVPKSTPAATLVQDLLLAAAIVDSARRVSLRLEADRTAPMKARRLLRTAGDDAELVTTAELLVSELVTNVVEHSRISPSVTVTVTRDRIRVEVADADPRTVTFRTSNRDGVGGHGLRLVDALSDRWGQDLTPSGKVVWFEICRPPALDPPPATADAI